MRLRLFTCLVLLAALCAGPSLALAQGDAGREQRRERREEFRDRWRGAGPGERAAIEREVRRRMERASPAERRMIRAQLQLARREEAREALKLRRARMAELRSKGRDVERQIDSLPLDQKRELRRRWSLLLTKPK